MAQRFPRQLTCSKTVSRLCVDKCYISSSDPQTTQAHLPAPHHLRLAKLLHRANLPRRPLPTYPHLSTSPTMSDPGLSTCWTKSVLRRTPWPKLLHQHLMWPLALRTMMQQHDGKPAMMSACGRNLHQGHGQHCRCTHNANTCLRQPLLCSAIPGKYTSPCWPRRTRWWRSPPCRCLCTARLAFLYRF